MDFVSGTSARAVIAKLDRIFSSLGIPVSVDNDNGPPFSGQEFEDFSKYLGFKHERKTPRNPQANGEAEQFMRVLKKLYQICRLTGQNFKQEVHRFLRSYRATPHCTTKLAPAELMFPSRKFRTRLPVGVIPRQLDFEELYQRDLEKKMQMKVYADNKKVVKTSDIQMEDSMLVKQDARRKATLPFEEEPLKVQYRKGSQVVAKRKDGRTITRSTAHFKRVPYQSNGETKRSTPAAVEPPQSTDLTNGVQQPDADYTRSRGVTNGSSDRTVEPNQPATPTQMGGPSARLRRSAGEYLRDKYPDCVLPDKIR